MNDIQYFCRITNIYQNNSTVNQLQTWVPRELSKILVYKERRDWYLKNENLMFSPVTKTGSSTMLNLLLQNLIYKNSQHINVTNGNYNL